ncbi:MAG: LSU ribosomal protein L5p (L11e), partial [uncultured Rubrobacteraceae bacterium]
GSPEDQVQRRDQAEDDRALRLLLEHAGAPPREDHAQHGRGGGQAGLEDARRRRGAARHDRGPEAQRPPRPQVGRRLQAARGHAGRPRGHAARRARVRVPRPPDVRGDPADPRLPGPEPALLRRARQLLDGHPRADHLPRDRLRRRRPGPGPRRHHHHHRQDGSGGVRAAGGAGHAVRPRHPAEGLPEHRRGRRDPSL